MALQKGASEVITGSFPNLSAVCKHLVAAGKNVLLGCSAWKDRVNMEDSLFAGAVINRVKEHFSISCDWSGIAETLYMAAQNDMYGFLGDNNATHYQRLTGFGLEKDLKYCLTIDAANVLPFYENEQLVIHKG